VPIDLSRATPADYDELFVAFGDIVRTGDGFPQSDPLSRQEFDDYWIAHSSAVTIARSDGRLVGASYIKANFVGRAAHIANAGYFVVPEARSQGLGRQLVERSLVDARACGFDAMQFNLVFVSNPARRLYRELGFHEIGQIPDAVDGEAAVIYWRRLD
jgi:ribosomal protein S18 acetylase RimI-like enzyme